jgi:hypothetical protein
VKRRVVLLGGAAAAIIPLSYGGIRHHLEVPGSRLWILRRGNLTFLQWSNSRQVVRRIMDGRPPADEMKRYRLQAERALSER